MGAGIKTGYSNFRRIMAAATTPGMPAADLIAEGMNMFSMTLDAQSEIEVYKIWNQLPDIGRDGFLSPNSTFGATLKAEQTSFTAKTGEELVAHMRPQDYLFHQVAATFQGIFSGMAILEGEEGETFEDDEEMAAVTEVTFWVDQWTEAYLTSGTEGLDKWASDKTYGMVTSWEEYMTEFGASTASEVATFTDQIASLAQWTVDAAVMRQPTLSDGVPYGDSPHYMDTYLDAETFIHSATFSDLNFAPIMEYGSVTDWKDIANAGESFMAMLAAGGMAGPSVGDLDDLMTYGFPQLQYAATDPVFGPMTPAGAYGAASLNTAATDRTCFLVAPSSPPTIAGKNRAAEYPQTTPVAQAEQFVTGEGTLATTEDIAGTPQSPYGPAVAVQAIEPMGRYLAAKRDYWIPSSTSRINMESYIRASTKKVSTSMAIMLDNQFLQNRQKTPPLTSQSFSALEAGYETTLGVGAIAEGDTAFGDAAFITTVMSSLFHGLADILDEAITSGDTGALEDML